MRLPREGDLVKAVLQLLALRGIPAWRQNAGRLRVERGGRTHLYRFSSAEGMSDVLGLLPPTGRLLAVEVKQPGRKPTAAQRAFLANVNAAGGLGLCVHSVAELAEALASAGR